MRRKQLTKEQIDEIRTLRESGLKLREIAEKLGVHVNTVRYRTPPHKPKGRKAVYQDYYQRNRDTIIARVRRNQKNAFTSGTNA